MPPGQFPLRGERARRVEQGAGHVQVLAREEPSFPVRREHQVLELDRAPQDERFEIVGLEREQAVVPCPRQVVVPRPERPEGVHGPPLVRAQPPAGPVAFRVPRVVLDDRPEIAEALRVARELPVHGLGEEMVGEREHRVPRDGGREQAVRLGQPPRPQRLAPVLELLVRAVVRRAGDEVADLGAFAVHPEHPERDRRRERRELRGGAPLRERLELHGPVRLVQGRIHPQAVRKVPHADDHQVVGLRVRGEARPERQRRERNAGELELGLSSLERVLRHDAHRVPAPEVVPELPGRLPRQLPLLVRRIGPLVGENQVAHLRARRPGVPREPGTNPEHARDGEGQRRRRHDLLRPPHVLPRDAQPPEHHRREAAVAPGHEVERARHLLARLEPVVRVLAQGRVDDRLNSFRGVGAQGPEAGRVVHEVVREHGADVRVREGRLPRHRLEQDAAERVDVRPPVDVRLAARLLRAHVGRRPQREAGAGQRLLRSGGEVGDPEVRDQRVPLAEQDVARLHVAVDDAVPVRKPERVGHLPHDPHGVGLGKPPVSLDPLPERPARDERHHVVEVSGGLAGVVEREDVGVIQPGDDLDLALEALRPDRVRELGAQDLDRDGPVVLDVAGEEHDRHGAATDLPLHLVARREGAPDRVEHRLHAGSSREGPGGPFGALERI